MTVVLSYDDGYGDNKLYDGVKELLIPTYITEWREEMEQEINPNGDKRHPYDYITIELEDEFEVKLPGGKRQTVRQTVKYLVGKGAIEQDSNGTASLGENKHKDKEFKYLMMACLGLLVENESTFVDMLSMGLPVKAAEDPSRHELLKKMIVGKPLKFTLTLADGTVLPRTIHIEELMIKKQPFGSHADLFLDENGEFNLENIEYADAYVGICDIGARTFNWYTLEGLKPISDLSNNDENGMFVAYKAINKNTIAKLTGYELPDSELPMIINEVGKINGHDLTIPRAIAYDNHANRIAKQVEKIYINSWAKLKTLIFTGGGSELLHDSLVDLLDNRPYLFLDRFATARGLRKLALNELNSRKKAVAANKKAAPKAAQEKGNEQTA
ncbi:ParM/StbA family protein (plasmid) [Paenibacillus peoriae]|uniref:ParM/StbA family protein n=1 Tax=Paenibacillus peoriae TaxID=59893 RepID=A0A7H0YHA4_9BACL|nr:ParM/StbA family protein [Paenibacillus peoriae]QNR70462.1 ParM/StbA family protein [Paenibacillus peoriae]